MARRYWHLHRQLAMLHETTPVVVVVVAVAVISTMLQVRHGSRHRRGPPRRSPGPAADRAPRAYGGCRSTSPGA